MTEFASTEFDGLKALRAAFCTNGGSNLTAADPEFAKFYLFMDAGCDGLLHRTAWPSVADGILSYDANGDDKLSGAELDGFKVLSNNSRASARWEQTPC